jgi:hypothetical protein
VSLVTSISDSRAHAHEQRGESKKISWLRCLKTLGCALLLLSGAGALGAAAQSTNSTFDLRTSVTVQPPLVSCARFGLSQSLVPFETSFLTSRDRVPFETFFTTKPDDEDVWLDQTDIVDPFRINRTQEFLSRIKANGNTFYTHSDKIGIIQGIVASSGVRTDILFEFISAHCRTILNSQEFFDILPMNLNLNFYKNLHSIGWDSSWFNTPTAQGGTLIQKLIRKGDIKFLKIIGQDIALKDIDLGVYFFKEEVKSCFLQRNSFLASDIKPGSMIAQNGCRMVVLEKDGRVRSILGQEARVVFQNMTGIKKDNPSFTVYLNDGHASISFEDGSHFGFYPRGRLFMKKTEKLSSTGSKKGAINPLIGKKISPGFDDSVCVGASTISGGFSPHFSTSCTIDDDSTQRKISEEYNQLILDFYSTDAQLAAVKQHVMKTKANCRSGNMTYHLLTMNCVDFVQAAIASTGMKADFRDAFYRKELIRRPGLATLFTMMRSRGPHREAADIPEDMTEKILESGSLPEFVASIGASTLFIFNPKLRKMVRSGLNLPYRCCQVVFSKASALWSYSQTALRLLHNPSS